MPTATVTSKRQITIPAETCRDLRIVPGARVDFLKNAAGETIIKVKSGDIRRLRGCVDPNGAQFTVQELDDAVADGIAADFLRSVS
jgi:antitoxin PrlF